jgi:hypothetical protein
LTEPFVGGAYKITLKPDVVENNQTSTLTSAITLSGTSNRLTGTMINNNNTNILAGGAFGLTLDAQTQTVGNGSALIPNLKGTTNYVAMWGIKNNFTKTFTVYNGTTLKGMGFPTIVNETSNGNTNAISTGLTTNSTNSTGGGSTYFKPTNNKSIFEIHGFIKVTAFTSGYAHMIIRYTDDAGTARQQNIELMPDTGTPQSFATATGLFSGIPREITSNPNTIRCQVVISGTLTYTTSCQIIQIG